MDDVKLYVVIKWKLQRTQTRSQHMSMKKYMLTIDIHRIYEQKSSKIIIRDNLIYCQLFIQIQ